MGGSVGGFNRAMQPSGGKSAPQTQNTYGSAYQAPPAQVYQPTYSNSMMGGKSSGAGQGGYGGAPGFGPGFGGAPASSPYNSTTGADILGGRTPLGGVFY